MKAINIKSLLVMLVIAACAFVSCKKNKDAAPDHILKGSWEGAYGYGGNEPETYFAFIIENNGTMKVKSIDKNNPWAGTGTWTLKDNEFKGLYQYEGQDGVFNVVAKFDEVENNLVGNWGNGDQNADAGKFYMFRQ